MKKALIRKAFTLIELLVVIAIIAILAAILFPVFAQAKLAAKKTQSLSGVKQLDLAIQMYLNDYDDEYLPGFNAGNPQGNWGEYTSKGVDQNVEWDIDIQPYVKNLPIFFSPVDSMAGHELNGLSWAGVGVSFSCNGWMSANGYNGGAPLRGPMGLEFATGVNDGWINGPLAYNGHLGGSQLTQPAGTILLAEKDESDIAKDVAAHPSQFCCTAGTYSAYGPWLVFGGTPVDWGTWGGQLIPNDFNTTPTGTFGYGPNGAVSTNYGGTMSVFSYCDGHAKTVAAVSTDPNPNSQPQNNQWDAMR
jgi:prepilin-type N-terminal cleavage/methylation domain-containing protein